MINRLRSIIYLFDAYTIFIWGWLILEFITKDSLKVPTSLTTVYIVILGIYVGDKEIDRLRKRFSSRNLHGERFVLLWVVTLITISIAIAFNHTEYRIPGDLPVITACVLLLWLISEYVKRGKQKKRR
jgi:hypothetical protein